MTDKPSDPIVADGVDTDSDSDSESQAGEIDASDLELQDDPRLEAMRSAYIQVVSESGYQRLLTRVSSNFLDEPARLSPGDVVQWKDGLKDREFPFYKRPMVYLGEWVRGDRAELFPTLSTELWDCWCGYISGDRDFQIFATDSRRLRPWPKDELSEE